MSLLSSIRVASRPWRTKSPDTTARGTRLPACPSALGCHQRRQLVGIHAMLLCYQWSPAAAPASVLSVTHLRVLLTLVTHAKRQGKVDITHVVWLACEKPSLHQAAPLNASLFMAAAMPAASVLNCVADAVSPSHTAIYAANSNNLWLEALPSVETRWQPSLSTQASRYHPSRIVPGHSSSRVRQGCGGT